MATPIQVGSTLGRYRILQHLGSGGMGVVFRAYDERLRREVAIKIVPPLLVADAAARQRFEHEARTLSGLNHPNIATLFDFDSDKTTDFIVMELLTGETLDDQLARGPIDEREIIRTGCEIASGLSAAHAADILHCDLKPANIRRCSDGRTKILDFGLARRLSPASDLSVTASVAHAVGSGTLPYMAPEQLRGQPLDARTDVWGFGVVLYEMAAARHAFPQSDAVAIIAAVLNEQPAAPRALRPKLSAELEAIILRCLQKDPAARFQFAADVGEALRALEPSTGDRPGRKSVFAAVIGVAVVVIALLAAASYWRSKTSFGGPIQSLAVLPMRNLNGDAEQDPLVDGMTEDLITDLAKIRALRVVSRTSIMRYRHTEKTLAQIAKELDVDAIVEGSVERAGDRIRISAQLIRAANDRHLWAESYDRQLRDVLLLQDEVARSIAREIQVTLTPADAARLSGARTVDPEAYQLYIKGRYFWGKRNEQSITRALDFFHQALDKDPTYAPAYSGIADCYASLGIFGVSVLPPNESMPKARDAAQKALALQDTLAEAHTSLAFIKMNYDWDWPGAESEFKRAIELNPGYANAHHWYAHLLLSQRRFDEALQESLLALKLDPLNPSITTHLGWHYYYVREYDKAIAQLQKTIEMDPSFGTAHAYLALAYLAQHQYERAIAECQKARDLLPDNVVALAGLGHAYAVSGKATEARRILSTLQSEAKRRFVSPYDLATVHLGLGDKNRAFEVLGTALHERLDLLIYLAIDPRLDPIRNDPRFAELMRRVGVANGSK